MWKKNALMLLVSGGLLGGAAAQTPNTLTPAEEKEGWTLLYDGKTTNGWHTYNQPGAGSAWAAGEGALHLHGNGATGGGGDLVTGEEYGDFDLKLQWKISPKGNSGIIFYVHEDPSIPDTYRTGPEMQVLDNDGHPDGKIPNHRAANLYDLIAAKPETVRPVGEWNDVEIRSVHGKLDFYLNGAHVVSTTMWDAHWKEMVQHSKFKSMPQFGTYKTGRIALQDHGDEVWFRNIRIKKLS